MASRGRQTAPDAAWRDSWARDLPRGGIYATGKLVQAGDRRSFSHCVIHVRMMSKCSEYCKGRTSTSTTFVIGATHTRPVFVGTGSTPPWPKFQDAIAREVQSKLIDKQNMPIRLNRVVVGSILPPKGVVEQTTQTIVQEQRKITMVEFQKAEEAREKAEKQRGIADRAYRESLGLTAPEFVDLRRIEVQKEIVQHSPTALTVIMGLERVGINMPSSSADR